MMVWRGAWVVAAREGDARRNRAGNVRAWGGGPRRAAKRNQKARVRCQSLMCIANARA